MLMPGHLLLYHPGVAKLKELVDSGELGDVLYVYGNRQNLGKIRRDENALWSLGAHDLSVILHLVGEEPVEVWARGESFLKEGVEDVVFCYLRFPSGMIAHMHLSWLDPHKMRRMTVVGTEKMAVFDDMELDRKVTVYDKAAEQPRGHLRRVAHPHRRHLHPADRERRAAAPRVRATSSRLVRGEGDPARGARGTASRSCARSSSSSARSSGSPRDGRRRERRRLRRARSSARTSPIGDNAVVGKQPTLGRRSTASRGAAPAARPRRRPAILAGAVVFAGTRLGSGVIVGDQACVRERCTIGDDVVIGRGSLVENDVDDRRPHASRRTPTSPPTPTLEEDVFIAPCVVTTNDNFMGRTEERRRSCAGPTIRRGARIGGGAVLLPGHRDRRGGVRRRRRGRARDVPPARSSSATRRGRSATCPTRSSSTVSRSF